MKEDFCVPPMLAVSQHNTRGRECGNNPELENSRTDLHDLLKNTGVTVKSGQAVGVRWLQDE
jgi:hypothetical protein